jgi:hypothetical protein
MVVPSGDNCFDKTRQAGLGNDRRNLRPQQECIACRARELDGSSREQNTIVATEDDEFLSHEWVQQPRGRVVQMAKRLETFGVTADLSMTTNENNLYLLGRLRQTPMLTFPSCRPGVDMALDGPRKKYEMLSRTASEERRCFLLAGSAKWTSK